MTVSLRVLGPLQLLVDGIDVTPAAPKERALLAFLGLSRRQVVPADRLLDELWPALAPDRARHALQVRVATLRKVLDGTADSSRLEFVAPGYRLRLETDEIDERRFARLVDRATTLQNHGEVAAAALALREALGVWRGEPLAGGASCPYLEGEVARMAEARLDAIEACVEAELACGYHQALTFELERLTAEHPFRERLWADRALALYRSGRQGEALRACNTARRRLADELGVEPGPALRSIERAILEQRPELDWSPPPETRRVLGLGPTEQPSVRYARAPDGVNIAYQVAGDAPVDLIIIPGFTSHLDIWWEPWSGRLARRLMTFVRLIVFDQRGNGLSDRPPACGVEHRMEDTKVVLDAVGSERAVVLGMSAGGTVAVLFAATYPERTQALILYGAQPRYLVDDDYPFGASPSIVEPAVQNVEESWGTGVLFERFCPSVHDDPVLREHYARFQRASASPGAAAADLRSILHMDVRHALPKVSAPTLVLHATGDLTDPVEAARYSTARIPNAKLVELDSADHLIWLTDALDAMVNEIQDFVLGVGPNDDVGRVLATLLFVEVEEASADEVAGVVVRYRGDVVRRDDGVLATFDGPARAIRCASTVVAELVSRASIRAGLHCGECELVGREVVGVAVQIARGIARLAPPGRVAVSQTVRDLVFGSEIALSELGCHSLDGVAGRWSAYLVAEP